jgi:hypothetical protein
MYKVTPQRQTGWAPGNDVGNIIYTIYTILEILVYPFGDTILLYTVRSKYIYIVGPLDSIPKRIVYIYSRTIGYYIYIHITCAIGPLELSCD